MLVLAEMPYWLIAALSAIFLFFCVLLILAVLIQRPTGGGLSGAFGSGAGSGQTAFGAKTGDALTYATITIFAIYVLLAVGLNYASRPASGEAAPAGSAATGPTGAAPASPATGPTGTEAPTGAAPAVVPPPAPASFTPPATLEPTPAATGTGTPTATGSPPAPATTGPTSPTGNPG